MPPIEGGIQNDFWAEDTRRFFRNREDAAGRLADRLGEWAGPDSLIAGIPRGGVVIARETARFLGADWDVVICHKIGHPENPEFAVGAVSESGEVCWDPEYEEKSRTRLFVNAAETERRRISERLEAYRGIRAHRNGEGRVVVVVDDGAARGWTMISALREMRRRRPARLICGLPVAPTETVRLLEREADEVCVVRSFEDFAAVSNYYEDFAPVSDEETARLLKEESAPR